MAEYNKSNDDSDYRYVLGKVPKVDKNGNDISDDKLGSGGTRRDDGTLSSLVSDLQEIDPDMVRQLQKKTVTSQARTISTQRQIDLEKAKARQQAQRKQDMKQLAKDTGRRFINRARDNIADAIADEATYQIERLAYTKFFPWVKNKWNEFTNPQEYSYKSKQKVSSTVESVEQSSSVNAEVNGLTPTGMKSVISSTYSAYQNDIDNEELQKKLFRITVLALMLCKELNDLPPDIRIEWKTAFEQLKSRESTEILNSVLQSNPSLLDDPQIKQLYILLDYGELPEGQFVKISNPAIRECLTID